MGSQIILLFFSHTFSNRIKCSMNPEPHHSIRNGYNSIVIFNGAQQIWINELMSYWCNFVYVNAAYRWNKRMEMREQWIVLEMLHIWCVCWVGENPFSVFASRFMLYSYMPPNKMNEKNEIKIYFQNNKHRDNRKYYREFRCVNNFERCPLLLHEIFEFDRNIKFLHWLAEL